jgi:hypothetical protein
MLSADVVTLPLALLLLIVAVVLVVKSPSKLKILSWMALCFLAVFLFLAAPAACESIRKPRRDLRSFASTRLCGGFGTGCLPDAGTRDSFICGAAERGIPRL